MAQFFCLPIKVQLDVNVPVTIFILSTLLCLHDGESVKDFQTKTLKNRLLCF